MNLDTSKLPPELQQRLANIVAQASAAPAEQQQQAAAAAPAPAPAPVAKPPSLLEHVVALRQEVDMLRQQIGAIGQVTEAQAQAVGQMYQMLVPQPQMDSGEDY